MSAPAQGTQAIDRAGELLARAARQRGAARACATSPRPPTCPRAPPRACSRALERHGLVHQAGERGKLEPGPAILRFAHRGGVERNLVELAQPSLDALAEAQRRDDQPRRARARRRRAPRPGRQPPLPRHRASGSGAASTTTAPPSARSSSPTARPSCPPGRLARLTPATVVDRATLDGRARARPPRRLRDGDRRARGRASPRSPRPSTGRRRRDRRAQRSRARRCA